MTHLLQISFGGNSIFKRLLDSFKNLIIFEVGLRSTNSKEYSSFIFFKETPCLKTLLSLKTNLSTGNASKTSLAITTPVTGLKMRSSILLQRQFIPSKLLTTFSCRLLIPTFNSTNTSSILQIKAGAISAIATIKSLDKVPSPGPISIRDNNLESIPDFSRSRSQSTT